LIKLIPILVAVLLIPSIAYNAYAVNDEIIDADGTASAGKGLPGAKDVMPGDPLLPFPSTGSPSTGLDWFDQDGNGVWTQGLDALHSEDPASCPTAFRDGIHQLGFDCKVVDESSSLVNGDQVDCDVEVGANFGTTVTVCPDPKMKFHDKNANGTYELGEDIVLDLNMNNIYDEETVVGGEIIALDTTALLLAGAQSSAIWMIPTLAGLAGAGLYLVKFRTNRE
jgi:hypothetical protein